MYEIGDEVKLKDGTIMVVTYIEKKEIEGFTLDGWVIKPLLRNVVEATGKHYDLPIGEKERLI